jgi:hypothetical protein
MDAVFFLSARIASRTRSVGVAQVSAITEKQDARVHSQHARAQRFLSIPVQTVDGTDGAGTDGAVSLQRDAHFGHFAFGFTDHTASSPCRHGYSRGCKSGPGKAETETTAGDRLAWQSCQSLAREEAEQCELKKYGSGNHARASLGRRQSIRKPVLF